MIENYEIDFASEEAQYKLLEWYDKIQRCYLCDESWIVENSFDPAYLKFNLWVR